MDPNNKPTPDQMAAFMKAMEQEHTLTFTKGELTAIFNILTQVTMKYGDFVVLEPVIKKLHPIVAVDSNIPGKGATPEDSLILGNKKGES